MSSEAYTKSLDSLLHPLAVPSNDGSVDYCGGLRHISNVFADPMVK